MPFAASGAADLTGPARHHFLSPHYDDIALSCGGTAALLARAGLRPEINVTCGAAPNPDQPPSAFARTLHRQWGLSAAEVITVRREEETAAAALLGATWRCLSLSDAIYRGSSYQTGEQLTGSVAAGEDTLPGRLVNELLEHTAGGGRVRYYAPLGIGGHVDHQVCFAAGVALAAVGHEVWFYEDLPYALVLGAGERRLADIAATWAATAPAPLATAQLRPIARVDISAVWEIKINAILAYPSQMPSVFRQAAPAGSREAIAATLRGYAMRAGDGVPAEQLWHLSGPEQSSENSWKKR